MNNSKIISGVGDTTVGATASAKDNLYLSVNGEWLKTAKIPSDKARTGGFSDLDLEVEKQLMQDFDEMAKDENKIDNDLMKETIKLYQVAMNTEKLDADGAKPLNSKLATINSLKNFSDINNQLQELVMSGVALPFTIDVDADMKDTSTNVVYMYAPSLILPDKTYYDNNPSGDKLLSTYRDVVIKTLIKAGFDKTTATELSDNNIKFDAKLVPHVKSSEEWADYTKAYNPMDFTEFTNKIKTFDLDQLITKLIDATPDKAIVTEPKYYEAFEQVMNDSFDELKAWMTVKAVMSAASLLSEDIRQTAGEYSKALSGSAELPDRKKAAFHKASGIFSEVVGVYYGEKYFGLEAKNDVIAMINKMVEIYKQRINVNTWLGTDTKKKAIVKLEKIAIKVGFPDKTDAIYNKFKIDTDASLFENIAAISRITRQHNFDKFKKPVDRNEWAMPGHMVNACYDPSRNDITFPAAILKAPFYSLEQSASENYGGIGAVIAHEISHAFDNNGSQFDELGNLNNWWTKEDYSKFEDLTKAMINEFDDIDFAGGKVNGTLVVSENVADAGGLSCALEAAKTHDDVNLQDFFSNWARVWRVKSTQQFAELLLSTDVHAPGPMRANIHAQNMDDFYSAFSVTEDDGMWLAPEKRVNIW
ncbi:peptidase M13 [Companilactobacillus sp. RD055328]|uniref:M13 family metallopeptidase n=1 Tax=Companilactobacillus sp. RD055328 TaxID=2916634 RepID=UPI001FC84735|nr:M13-type metalloendopeptidase [Companilactobacillus sp. RD055328]GKQ43233.1 peptidase M13 [Companilactobacillus sp. RD055328]